MELWDFIAKTNKKVDQVWSEIELLLCFPLQLTPNTVIPTVCTTTLNPTKYFNFLRFEKISLSLQR